MIYFETQSKYVRCSNSLSGILTLIFQKKISVTFGLKLYWQFLRIGASFQSQLFYVLTLLTYSVRMNVIILCVYNVQSKIRRSFSTEFQGYLWKSLFPEGAN